MSACAIVLSTATILCAPAIRKRVRRPAAVRRQRCRFETVVQYPSPHDFTRCFRMPRNVFYKLLSLLKPRLMRNANMGRRSSGGIIEPAVRLAMFLRILSGASYLDLEIAFRVGRSTIYSVFLSTLNVVLSTIPMPGVPVDDAAKLRELAKGYCASRFPSFQIARFGVASRHSMASPSPCGSRSISTFQDITLHVKGSTTYLSKLLCMHSIDFFTCQHVA
jgi:hypothetical protein